MPERPLSSRREPFKNAPRCSETLKIVNDYVQCSLAEGHPGQHERTFRWGHRDG